MRNSLKYCSRRNLKQFWSSLKIFVNLFWSCLIGRAEKWKRDILKHADVDYWGTIYIEQGPIEKNRIFKILTGYFFVLEFWRPLHNSKKKCVHYIGFMVLKSTGLSLRLQRKNRVYKTCIESWDISQNAQNFTDLVWRPEFGLIF